MSTPNTTVVKTDEKFTEFVPFGAEDKIKLSIAMVKNLIAVRTKSGATCSDNDAIKFVAMCLARKLNPFEGDAFLIGYDSREKGPTFSLITAHQAFLKRAELNKEYDGMKSGVIVEDDGKLVEQEGDFHTDDQKLVGGWATVFFKNRKQPMNKKLRLSRFQKPFGVWQDDPAGMIVKCAEADALRSSFPTMLGGLYLKEEVESTNAVPPKTSTPIFTSTVEVVPEETAATDDGPIEAEEPPPEKPSKKPDTSPSGTIKSIRSKLSKEKVSELALIAFLKGMGVIEESDTIKSLEDCHAASDTAIAMLQSQLEDVIRRMKEAT